MAEEVKEKSMLELYNEVSGRSFESEAEAVEHLANLQKLAFKKKEEVKDEFRAQLEADFTKKTEDAVKAKEEELKAQYEPFKKFIEQANIRLDKVNPLAIAEYLGEQHEDIKPRTEAVDSQQEAKTLEEKIESGKATQEDRARYVRLTVLKNR